MNRKKRSGKTIVVYATLALMLSGCMADHEVPHKDDDKTVSVPVAPVGDNSTTLVYKYCDEGSKQSVINVVHSADGLCCIKQYPDYYEVELNYDNADPWQVAQSYGRTIPEIFPDYIRIMEGYLHENIRLAFGGGSYSEQAVIDRIETLFDSLPDSYAQEVEAMAGALSNGEKGICENGIISFEEAVAMQMIPDALRPSACSALSLWGSKTHSGDGITVRVLEWYAGSEDQLSRVNCITHFNHSGKSFTSIGMLGLLDIISAINDEGVFAAILDVGANGNHPFVSEGKQCYTFALRKALEDFSNAEEVGTFMVENSGSFTFCHNLIITDSSGSYCAENCVKEVSDAHEGFSVLRDSSTPLLDGLCWESDDSLCVVNSFACAHNQDSFTSAQSNLVRFAKYNKWVREKEKFTVADVKDMITQENTQQENVCNVHGNSTVQLILIDYHTESIQVAFTGSEGVTDKPDFIDVGSYIR